MDVEDVILLTGARQVIQIVDKGELRLCGNDAKNPSVLKLADDATEGFTIAWCARSGCLLAIGSDAQIAAQFPQPSQCISASGCTVLPGFVDAHCHPVWAGCRLDEFVEKLSGVSYMEILKRGGGILKTALACQNASQEDLAKSAVVRFRRALRCGTTTSEAKSGYGLDWATELKLLRALQDAAAQQAVELSITYLGAHAVPSNSDADAATKFQIEESFPRLAQARAAGLTVHQADVFIERGVFSAEQARQMLLAAKAQGLRINAHADELSWSGGAELCGELGASAASHLEQVSEAGIVALSAANVVAVMLPTTAHYLHLPAPPIAALRAANVALALGSDFNPNAPCSSMPMAMHLACLNFGFTAEEALVAATLNAAAALDLSHRVGSLEVGKQADLLVLASSADWRHLIYQTGQETRLIRQVFKRGQCVFSTSFDEEEMPIC